MWYNPRYMKEAGEFTSRVPEQSPRTSSLKKAALITFGLAGALGGPYLLEENVRSNHTERCYQTTVTDDTRQLAEALGEGLITGMGVMALFRARRRNTQQPGQPR
jgi:hypothetical protein